MAFDSVTKGQRPGPLYDYGSFIVPLTSIVSPTQAYVNSTEGRQRVRLAACNRTASDTTVNGYLVSSGSPAATNAFWFEVPLAGRETLVFPFELILKAGWSLYFTAADAARVNIVGSVIIEV